MTLTGRVTLLTVLLAALFLGASCSSHQPKKLRADVPARELQDTCAEDGDRAVECGSDNDDRPALCCDGLACDRLKCVVCAPAGEKSKSCGANRDNRPEICCAGLVCNDDSECVEGEDDEDDKDDETPAPAPKEEQAPAPEENCAAEMDRAQDCGAENTDRPQSCCEGLVCSTDTAGSEHMRCIVPPPIESDQPEDIVDVDENCAEEDERAQDCGADNPDRPQSCCAGLVCSNVKCIVPPPTEAPPPTAEETDPPTLKPTATPTAAPIETSPPEPAATAQPTTSTASPTVSEATPSPTRRQTDEPTEEPTTPPSTQIPTSSRSGEPTFVPIEILPPSAAPALRAVCCAVAACIAGMLAPSFLY